MTFPPLENFINGEFAESKGERLDVDSPIDGQIITSVPLSTSDELNQAVLSAKKAFEKWSEMPIKERVQIFYRYRDLLLQNIDSLSELIQIENGKTLSESRAEIEKAIELTEFACSLPQIVGTEVLEVSKGVTCQARREPLGVVASIVPFNFPSMVPHWSMPNAIVLGNTMVMKPSEKVPLSMNRAAALLNEAGLPPGVFNLVNGDKAIAEAICDHPEISAVSFVGSTKVAKQVYSRSATNHKRVLALGGAKNHLIVLPDAQLEMTAENVMASVTGCAGQRCMAAAVMVGVSDVDQIVERICEEARKIVPGKNLGAVISAEAKERIENYITEAEKEGAKVLVDGRNASVDGKSGGHYVGPTVIDGVTPEMKIAKEEVFGPVLSIIRTNSITDAIAIENNSPYGNAASVFTQNGKAANQVVDSVSAGMVGVNIGVPVPREPFSFGGWNESKFGACDITGKSSIEFWTNLKKTTSKWNPEAGINWMS